MRKLAVRAGAAVAVAVGLALSPVRAGATTSDAACWGQATQVFAQMGVMGEHAGQQSEPRVGLRNLAVALYEQGALPEPSIQALGAFVSSALGLSIEACG